LYFICISIICILVLATGAIHLNVKIKTGSLRSISNQTLQSYLWSGVSGLSLR